MASKPHPNLQETKPMSTEAEPKAPLPWSVKTDPTYGGHYLVWIEDANGVIVAVRNCRHPGEVAHRIVRAVNAHDELLAKLKALTANIRVACDLSFWSWGDWREEIAAAEAAVARAEGREG